MKPPAFDYHAPDSVAGVLEVLAQYGDDAKPLAGGQSLVPAMSFRLARPSVLVDLGRVPGLEGIRSEGGELRFGAMTRQRELEASALVAERLPLLSGVLPHIAHPQIRNRGTVGGSLAHADPAAELPAVLLALGGRCRIRSSAGERWVGADDFYTGLFETALGDGDLLVEVALPEEQPRSGWGFHEFARRHGDYALVGVVAQVHLDGRRLRDGRIALLSVGDGPVRAVRAEQVLRGLDLDDPAARDRGLAEAARLTAHADIDPPGDLQATAAFRRHLAEVLTRRALDDAVARALGELAPAT
ncbi:MAG: xanthine dehydrogenase family protein subunit M [Acidobacteriota bacterium]